MATVPERRVPERQGQRGAATVLALAGVALCAVLLAGTARLGSTVAARARLAGAADLTALAAVIGGHEGAADVAQANGVALVSVAGTTDRTVVTVSGPGGAARAAAQPAQGQRGWGGGRG